MTTSLPARLKQAPDYDALIQLGDGPFPNANTLTTGTPLAWYESREIVGLFGGRPNARQVADFDNAVLQRVQKTFELGEIRIAVTDDPDASAAHSLSVVSNSVNPTLRDAIGMSYIGGNGFHFLDNAARYATSVDQLGWIVAHNVAHELMLAFGVPEVHDQTGRYIDATVGQLSMMLDPGATFSPGAIEDLRTQDFRQEPGLVLSIGAQTLKVESVPEPATFAIWVLGTLILTSMPRSTDSMRPSTVRYLERRSAAGPPTNQL